MKNKLAFTLLEILVVIVIIGFLATVVIFLTAGLRGRANDVKRKAELSQIGKFLMASCYLPDAGAGTYDLIYLINELKAKNAQYQQLIATAWHDPKTGSATQANYFYIVTDDKKCVLYANLENSNELITLSNFTSPTPGGGTGVFASTTTGFNGTNKYFQVTN